MRNLRVGIVSPSEIDVADDDVVTGDETGRGRRLAATARGTSLPSVATDDEMEPELQALVNTLRRVPPLPRDVRARALARARAVVEAVRSERRRSRPPKAVRDGRGALRTNANDVRR